MTTQKLIASGMTLESVSEMLCYLQRSLYEPYSPKDYDCIQLPFLFGLPELGVSKRKYWESNDHDLSHHIGCAEKDPSVRL
jgi:hypothetical protein